MIDRLQLRWSVNLQAALALVAEQAIGTEARCLCSEIAASVAETRVVLPVPAVVLLCEACEDARRRGDQELTEKLERLVAALKRGESRRIVATLGYHLADPSRIDDALEDVRRVVIADAHRRAS